MYTYTYGWLEPSKPSIFQLLPFLGQNDQKLENNEVKLIPTSSSAYLVITNSVLYQYFLTIYWQVDSFYNPKLTRTY